MEVTFLENNAPTKPQEPWSGVVKVQRSVFGTESVLIYNKDRSLHVNFVREDMKKGEWPTLTQWFDKNDSVGRYKVYMHARVDENGLLELVQRCAEQDW